jgi:hypothetical protein
MNHSEGMGEILDLLTARMHLDEREWVVATG